jgi:hypothetical protein
MKRFLFVALLALIGCDKDEVKPARIGSNSMTGTLKINASCNFPGQGGNQIEYSINGGDTTIVTFPNGKVIDTTVTSGQSYYVKLSSLDYSQLLNLTITFSGTGDILKAGTCKRNTTSPDNCFVELEGIVP